jgi:hypothetical protein
MTGHVEGYRAALEAAGALVESFESSGTDLTGEWAATVSYGGRCERVSGRYFDSWEHDELLYCFGADWRERLDLPEVREQFVEFGRNLLART